MVELRECPECGAEVPIGRLSCSACGALLAAVDRHPAVEPSTRGGAAPIAQDARTDVAEPDGRLATDVVPTPTEVAPAPAAPGRISTEAPDAAARSDRAVGSPGAVPAAEPPIAASSETSSAPAPMTAAAPPATIAVPDEVELPRPPMPPIPGGYLAPSMVMRSAPITSTEPYLGAPRAALEPAPSSGPPLRGPEPPSPVEPAPGSPPRVPVLDLPFAIAPGIGPRLVVGGGALSILAFVLPWASDGGVVIGAAFGTGYFSAWGLAAVANVLPFLVAWVSLVLAVLPNRVPRFAALGVLPLLLGGIFAGFGWTYLIAPLGAGIGIWALAVGAVLLAAGGILVLRGEDLPG